MRKLLLLTVSLLLTATTLFAERVSQEDAALVAKNFMSASTAQPGVKKSTGAKMVLKKAASATENQYYVYENASGEGWVMVAADDAITPILAYSKTGTFRTDNMPINVRKWLGKYDNFIKKVEADGFVATEEAQNQWKKFRKGLPDDPAGTVVIGPLVQTQWDQDEPYNNLCPGTGTSGQGSTKAYTGCVATAMAQVMKYWNWPVKGTGSHSYTPLNPNTGGSQTKYGTQSANFGNTTYDWDNMLNKYTSSATSTQKTAVATLMYHCGVATEMMYGDYEWGGSGTYTTNYGSWTESDNAQNALYNYFGYKQATGYMRDGYTYEGTKYYDSWTDAAWTAMVKEELDKSHPIMYGGAGDEGGHSFICDGYDTQNYFHFNWGWSGSNDGWYKLDNLVPGSGGAGGGSYSFSEDQDVIIGIIPDRTDLPNIAVKWSVDGNVTIDSIMQNNPLVLPSNPADCSGTGGKKFVGWTAQSSITGGAKPSDLFTTAAGKTVTEEITYYAVFAAQEGGSTPASTSTYTFTSKAWADATHSWTSSKDGNALQSGQGVQVTEGVSGAGAAMSALSSGVTKVVVNYCTNASKGAGSITVNVGSASLSKDVTKTGGTTLRDLEFTFDNASGAVSFTVTCTTNSIYVNSIAITSGGGATYSDYSLSCVTETKTLQSIAINTDNVKKNFTVGETFNSTGLVVTATYRGDDSGNTYNATVTDFTISSPDMSTTGQKTVTVSYTYGGVTKTATYNITVANAVTYTIGFYNNGQLIGSTQTVTQGSSPTLPTGVTAGCDDYTFVGWATAQQTTETTTKPTIVTNFTATQNQNYYAIFSRTESSQGSGSSTFNGAGTYKIYADVSGTKYYLTGTANSSSKIESTTTEADAPEFTIAAVSDGYTIKTGDNYIYYKGSSTNVGVSTTAYTWTITASTAGFGSWRVGASTATTRALVFANNQYKTFGGYATSNIDGSAYFDLEIVGNGSSSTTYYTSAPDCSTPPVTTKYTVRWHSCAGTTEVQYNEGQSLVFPATPAANAGKAFYGWTTTEHYTGATAPTIISAGGAVNADADYYAVYK